MYIFFVTLRGLSKSGHPVLIGMHLNPDRFFNVCYFMVCFFMVVLVSFHLTRITK